jgi:four helix bundle protein
MKENIVREKSFNFALKIVTLARKLRESGEHVLSRRVLRSGTSIGANVEEAQAAQSRKEVHSKMTIAFKEAWETRYWLRLLQETNPATVELASCMSDIEVLIRIISSITKKTKGK